MKTFLLSIVLALALVFSAVAQQSTAGTPATLQSAATATGNGTAIVTERFNALRLKVIITATATVTFEVQTDGTNWDATSNAYNVTSPTTAVGSASATGSFVVVTGGAPFRARISSYSSGTVTVTARPFYATTAKAINGGAAGAGSGDALVANPLSQFAPTTSAEFFGVISNETGGSGVVVGSVNPAITGGTHTGITGLGIRSTGAAFDLNIASSEVLTASRTLSIILGDAARSLTIGASASVSGTNTGDQTSVTGNAGTATALQNARTINGTSFDGTGNITVTAAAGTLTGTTLNSSVVSSSLTSVGTIASGVWSGTAIAATKGGTGLTSGTSGGVPYFSSTTAIASSGALGASAIVVGGGAGAAPATPSATTTLDSSGNVSTPGSISTGVGGSVAGTLELAQGTAPSLGTTSIKHYAPTSVTSYGVVWPAAAFSGIPKWTNSSNVVTVAQATAGTDYVTPSSTETHTNKTFDVEGTGNIFTSVHKVWFPAAGCNNATASSFWDLPTSTPAVAACVTGTNTQKGVLDFADTSGGFSAQNSLLLPADFTGTVDANITWTTTATSGNAKWSLSTICTATNATETDDPAFNTASTVTTAAPGTASRIQTSAITSLTITGCAAGELLHLKIFRDGNDASDTLSATVRLIGVELSLRRQQ